VSALLYFDRTVMLVKNFLVKEMAMFEDEGSEAERVEHSDGQNRTKHL
jgi:hypothetical protein